MIFSEKIFFEKNTMAVASTATKSFCDNLKRITEAMIGNIGIL